jgi:hypothetical protein
MRRVREVLRLRTAGVGLARRVGVAPSTVRLTLKRLASAGLSWPLPAEMTDSALEAHCSLRSAASKVIAVAPSPKDATVITVCRAVNSHRSTAAAARSGSTSKAGFRVRHGLEERDALYQTGQDAASHKSPRDQGTTVAICPSPPHPAHASGDIDPYALARASCRRFRFSLRPGRRFEEPRQLVGNEAAARRINMAVALGILAMREKALWNHKMEIVLGAGHRDIEKAPLLLYLGRGADAEVRRNASIDDVEHEDRSPFLAFGGMDGRKGHFVEPVGQGQCESGRARI